MIQGGRVTDRAALRDLYSKFGGTVYGRCCYLLKDPMRAEDAMQDVFAKALTHWSDFREDASPLTWLMKIATHHCFNVLRAERASWRAVFQRQEQDGGGETGGPQMLEARDLLRRALARFDVETQTAVVHYHLDGMTLEEVAAALVRSVPTVRKRLEQFAKAAGEDFKP